MTLILTSILPWEVTAIIQFYVELLTVPLGFGFYLTAMNQIRQNFDGNESGGSHQHLLLSLFYVFPLGLMMFLYEMMIIAGLSFFVLPGFYLFITLSFAPYIFLEFHHEGVDVIEAFSLSRKVVHKSFGGVLKFQVIFGLMFIGGALSVVGFFVVLPLYFFSCGFAVDDLFGHSPINKKGSSCVCCWDPPAF